MRTAFDLRLSLLALCTVVAGGLACGTPTDATDSGPVPDAPDPGGPADPGPRDPGPIDPGPVDLGPVDVGPVDPGPSDLGPTDPGPADDGPDTANLKGRDEPCTDDAECAGGACIRPFKPYGWTTGYCSKTCATDADCAGGDPTWASSCVKTEPKPTCFRTCKGGTGCPAGDACFLSLGVGWFTYVDACITLGEHACKGDRDCPGTERCQFGADRDRLFKFCLTPQDNTGIRAELRAGDACDMRQATLPSCRTAADCPEGWTCRLAPGTTVTTCSPPPAGTCPIACEWPGRCTGPCDSDADCEAGQRCAKTVIDRNYLGSPDGYDDAPVVAGMCTASEGSGTSCVRAGDCAGTGQGGADEQCLALDGMDGDGGRCVTAFDGPTVVGPGEACGDDPATPEWESRECAGGVCVNKTCGAPCAVDGDCPAGRCVTYSYPAPGLTQGFCTVLPPACESQADCAADRSCLSLLTPTEDIVACFPFQGSLALGEPCRSVRALLRPEHACRGLCIADGWGVERDAAGHCGVTCKDDGECAADQVCTVGQVTIDNRGTLDPADDTKLSSQVCFWLPGSRQDCSLTADCPAGEACLPWVSPTLGARKSCTTGVAGGQDPGESCSAKECFGRWCEYRWSSPLSKFCTGLCEVDEDCPEGLACRLLRGPQADLDARICLEPDDPRGAPLN